MKKVLITVVMVLVFFFIYFLQANFFNWFTIAGVKPNIFVILIIFVSLFASKGLSIPFSIFAGIIIDALIGRKIGISGICFGLIAILGIYFDKNFSKDSKLTIIFMIVGATMLYEIGMYMMQVFMMGIPLEMISFGKILIIEIVYNIFITIIFYPAIRTLGHYVEENFKGTKILTRYF